MKIRHYTYLIAGIFFLMLVSSASKVLAQSADDEVIGTWNPMSQDYQTLYKTKDGHLIFKRSSSDTKSSTDFYEKETLLLSAIISLTMEKSEYVDQYVITISTQDNAVFKERHVGGETHERYITGFSIQIPLSEKSKADSILERLRSLTGK